MDHFIDNIKSLQKSFQNMGSFLRLVQVILCSSGDDLFLVLNVIFQHIKKIQNFRLIVHKGKHDNTKGILKLRMLIKLIQYDIRICVTTEINHNSHSLTVGMIIDTRDSVDFLIAHKLGDFLYQPRLIHHIRKFCDDNLTLAVWQSLDIGNCADTDLSASGPVGIFNSAHPENLGASRKIRSLDDMHDFIKGGLSVLFNLIIDDFDYSTNNLPEIMRRNIRCHADSDSRCAIDQKIRNSCRKNGRLFFRIIEVRNKVNRILVHVTNHLHRDFAQPCLCITHCRGSVSVDRTEVSMTVNEGIPHIPVLRHRDKRSVNGRVSVRMIFSHRITDNTGTFSVRLVGSVIQFYHGIQNSSLYRFQTVTYIRKRS